MIENTAPVARPHPVNGDVTDRELLARINSHADPDAFAEIVRRHGLQVLRACRRILCNRHDADDAFQATFLVFYRKAGSIDRPEQLNNWLHGVAVRVATRARAATARRRSSSEFTDVMAGSLEPSTAAAFQELELILDEELRRLPERDRAALSLCYLEGKTHQEAAAELGCPVGSMSWRLSRARAALHDGLMRRGVMLSVGAVFLLCSAGRAAALAPLCAAECATALIQEAPASALTLAESVLLDQSRTPGWASWAAIIAAVLAIGGVAYMLWQERPGCAHAPAPVRSQLHGPP